MKLTLERDRPTDIKRIAKAIAVGVAVAIPALMFVAPLVAKYQRATLATGDLVTHIDPDEGYGMKGMGRVVEKKRNGDIVVKRLDGSTFVAPARELHED